MLNKYSIWSSHQPPKWALLTHFARWENWGTAVTCQRSPRKERDWSWSWTPCHFTLLITLYLRGSPAPPGLWALQGRGACRQPHGLLGQGRLQQAVASCLLRVHQVLRAAGGPHLLLEGRCALVRPPLLREPAAPLLRLRWGESQRAARPGHPRDGEGGPRGQGACGFTDDVTHREEHWGSGCTPCPLPILHLENRARVTLYT